MKNITVNFTEDEIQNFFQAYLMLQQFIEKILPEEVIYKHSFLEGVREAAQDIGTGQTREVHSFDDFVS
jgi:hypothetical protein